MTADVIDGTSVAEHLSRVTARRARDFAAAHDRMACLATVLVGEDPASQTYVRMKAKRCAAAGIASQRHELPATADTEQVVRLVSRLSADPEVDGILVQHPVPEHVDERSVFEAISGAKDVDGVTTASFAATVFGRPGLVSCTPGGIMRLLDAYEVDIAGLHAVVVGRSPILGMPIGMLLLGRDATVTWCHSKTADLAGAVASADILVAAAGRPALIEGRWIKAGSVVVDAGYNRGNVGDVEYQPAAARARLITPVPGGVGPMTIAVLLSQTVDAAVARNSAGSVRPG